MILLNNGTLLPKNLYKKKLSKQTEFVLPETSGGFCFPRICEKKRNTCRPCVLDGRVRKRLPGRVLRKVLHYSRTLVRGHKTLRDVVSGLTCSIDLWTRPVDATVRGDPPEQVEKTNVGVEGEASGVIPV